MIELTIVTPVLGSEAKLISFLLSIKKANEANVSFETIIVDDGSPVSLETVFRTFSKENNDLNLVMLRNEKNLGRSESRNKGLSLAKGNIVLFLDVDNLPEKGAFSQICSLFLNPEISAVRGNVQCDERHLKSSAYIRFFGGRYLGARGVSSGDLSYRYFASDALAVRRHDLLSINGFDENFKKYGCEDEELGHRYKASGKKFYFSREAHFIDSDLPSLNRECERMICYARYSFPLLKSKHPGVESDALMHFIESDNNKYIRIFLLLVCRKSVADFIKMVLNFVDGYSLNSSTFLYYYVIATYYVVGYKSRCSAGDKNGL